MHTSFVVYHQTTPAVVQHDQPVARGVLHDGTSSDGNVKWFNE